MTSSIFSDGKEYISASRASKKVGYSSDYVGQLCRSKKVPGKLIGRTWYVDLSVLINHKKSRYTKRFKESVVDIRQDNRQPRGHKLYRVYPSYYFADGDFIPNKKPILHLQLVKEIITTSLALLLAVTSSIFLVEKVRPQAVSQAERQVATSLFSIGDVFSSITSSLKDLRDIALDNIFTDSELVVGDSELETEIPDTQSTNKARLADAENTNENIGTSQVSSPPPPTRQIASTVSPPQTNLDSLRNELRRELQEYVRFQINTTTGNLNLESFKRDEVVPIVYKTVTVQSDSDASRIGTNLAELESNIRSGGSFSGASITGSSFSGSVGASTLTFSTATGTSATTTSSLFSNILTGSSISIGGTATSTINSTGDLLVVGSTTLQNFTARNSTSTNATSTTLAISGNGAGLTFYGTGNHDIIADSGTLRIGANTIIGNIIALDDTVDIGDAGTRFDKIYANEVNATTLVGTLTGGNLSAETFNINSDNATADTEDSYVAFERGTVSPNALLQWDSTNDRFVFNSDLFVNSGIGNGSLLINSSTTLQNFTAQNSTSTSATTTNSFSTTASSTSLSGTNISGFGLTSCAGSSNALTWTSNTFGCNSISSFSWDTETWGVSTSTTLGFLDGFLSTASSTIDSNLIITGNSTTTNATTTNFFSTTASSTNLFSSLLTVGNNALTVNSSGQTSIASSTPWGLFSINPNALGSGVPEFVIGSSTATHFIVDGSGNVGIGTTSPGGKLVIRGGEGQTDINFEIGENVSTPATHFVVTGWGRVGIGTTNPTQILDVSGSLAISGSTIFSGNHQIKANTSDGSDNLKINLIGGGASATNGSRGAEIQISGNEAGDAGRIVMFLGDATNSELQLFGNSGALKILGISENDGSATFTSSNVSAGWKFNSTGATSGFVEIQTGGATRMRLGNDANILATGANVIESAQDLYLRANSNNSQRLLLQSGAFSPTDNVLSLGKSGARWTELWAVSATIQTSDIRYKTDLIPSLGLDFINSIDTFGFKRIGDQSDKRHFGVSAQQTYDTLQQFGITEPTWLVYKPDDESKEVWGVAEGEFIAPLIKSVQELDAKASSLSFRIEELENKGISLLADRSDAIFDLDILFGSIVKKFYETMNIVFEKGLIKVAKIVTNLIETKKIVAEELELKDSATGEIYCVKIVNGEWEKKKCGEAGSMGQESITMNQEPEVTNYETDNTASTSEKIIVEGTSSEVASSSEEVLVDQSIEESSTTTEEIIEEEDVTATTTEEVATTEDSEVPTEETDDGIEEEVATSTEEVGG